MATDSDSSRISAERTTIASHKLNERVSMQAWLTLAVLLIFYLISVVDKQMIALVANPLGRAMNLDDSELGVILGVAFGLFYTISVLGAGWLLDKYSKKRVLLIAVLGWSIAAACTGLVQSFEQLFLVRALVGIGEGFLPTAGLAIIASAFPRRRIAMATSIFFSGASLGSVAALSLGGAGIAWLNAQGGIALPYFGLLEPWRAALLLSALPGIPLAFLALLMQTRAASASSRPATIKREMSAPKIDLIPYLRRNMRFVVLHILAFGFQAAGAYAIMMWSPAYLERTHGWQPDRIGYVLAVGSLLGGSANIIWGVLADQIMARRRVDSLYLVYSATFVIAIVLAGFAFLFASSAHFMPIYLCLTAFALGGGGMSAACQIAVPAAIRARVMGFQTLSGGILGIGLAPTIVPILSQRFVNFGSPLGLAIFSVAAMSFGLAVVSMIVARKYLRIAMEEVEPNHQSTTAKTI